MASIGNHDDDDKNNEQQQSRPAPERVHRQPTHQPTLRSMVPMTEREHPRVLRPHRDPPPTQPIPIDEIDTLRLPKDASQQSQISVDQIPTYRLTPQPGSLPAVEQHQPLKATIPQQPWSDRSLRIEDRNDLHTIYNLTSHAFTKVSGFYEVHADIKMDGEIMLYSIAVGREWKSVPFYMNHEAVQGLIAACRDAATYYHFPDDDDEGA